MKMAFFKSTLAAAALAAASMLVPAASNSAQADAAYVDNHGNYHAGNRYGNSGISYVGYRHRSYGHRYRHRGYSHRSFRHRYGRGYGHRSYGYGHRYRHRGHGGAVAAGIIGLAAGALISDALAAPRYHRRARHARTGRYAVGSKAWYRYCRAKYRSFDARSGTFQPYHGPRKTCR